MKLKITEKTPKLYSFFAILLSLIIILPSCSKDDDNQLGANVMIVNSVQGSSAQDFYLNNSKLNSSAVAYAESSSYINTSSGSKTAEFKNSGSTTVNTSSSATLEDGKYYTFYYSGSGSATSTTKTEDDMSAPPSGKAKVRYLNLNASSSFNVDFSLSGTSLGSNLAYKAASNFSTVDAGAQTFKVMTAGTSSLQFDFPVTLQAGKIYTIWASGNLVSTARVITHN